MEIDFVLSDKFFEFTKKLEGCHAKIKAEKDKMKDIYAAHKKVIDDLKAEAAVVIKEFEDWKAQGKAE